MEGTLKEYVGRLDAGIKFSAKALYGLVAEAAELLEHFRFRSDEEMEDRLRDEARRAEIGHELADVLYFVLLMSANLGYDVSMILRDKLELSARKYPVDQARGVNVKYTELNTDSGESH